VLAALTLTLLFSAQLPPQSVDWNAVRARYAAADYEQTLALLTATQPVDDVESARVAAFIGVVHAEMGDDAKARESFARAAAIDACVVFPDVRAQSRVRAAFYDVVKRPAGAAGPVVTTSSSPAWPVPAGIALAAAGGVAWAGAAIMGGLALSTSASAQAAAVQTDALLLDTAAREQAIVANALVILGGALVVGGAATAGLGVLLE
jgi:hypothetical protein